MIRKYSKKGLEKRKLERECLPEFFQKHIEIEIGPSKSAKRKHNSDYRREGGRDHERYLAEEDDRNDAAGQDTEDVVGQPVALHCVADFELHDGHAR